MSRLRGLRATSTLASLGAVALAACHATAPPPVKPPMPPDQRATILPASASPVSFDRIAAFPAPGWQIPRQVRLSPDGKLITYLQSESQSADMALFAFDVASHKHSVLVRAGDLAPSDKPMSHEEELRRERQRQRIKGVTGYAWAERASVMLLPLGGNIFVRTEDGAIKQLTDSDAPEIDPKLCADGSKVAFARGREIFVVDVASGRETQLTQDAPPGVTRGQSDFNMQEEFAEPSGLWWSPSCDRLAYLEVDERDVARVPIMGYRQDIDLEHHRYPRAGTRNPVTRLGVLDLAERKTTWIELDAGSHWNPADQYLGRLSFSLDGSALLLQRLSRDQRHLAVVRADPRTGKTRHLLEQHADTWVDMTGQRPVEGGALLLAWRDEGHRHLRVVDDATGATRAQLTSGDWDVSEVVAAGDGRVLFVANKDAVLDRVLYSVPLAGGPVTRLSREAGVHSVSAGRPSHGWIDIHSASDRPPRADLFDAGGNQIGRIEVPKDDDFDRLKLRAPAIVRLDNSPGPELYGALLEPRDRKPGVRYPAIVMVYGGPGVQTVLNEFNPRPMWQHLADRGFVVFQVDNRGSTGRGHAFEAPIHRRLGDVELRDQLRGLEYLKGLPFVDAERVGIYGHSYGGYMAVLAMLRAPGKFKAAVSGSPVVDWRFYDTGYTERYLGTPQGNPEGYGSTELAHLAAKLAGKLLVIHALMDENVHFQHTAKLVDALVAADKDFDLLVFPGERHGYRDDQTRRYAFRRVVDFFVQNL